MIPFFNLQRQYFKAKNNIDLAIQDVLQSGRFIKDRKCMEFERKFAEYHGSKRCVSVANGTDALILALKACGIGRGDKVVTTPFSFFASSEAIVRVGATPVFADVEMSSFNINPEKMESLMTKKIKAILPVHLFGNPCRMDEIMELAKIKQVKVIEDCAQAFGSTVGNKKVGTFGDIGCFSFFPSKNLGCYGDGGAIVTNDEEAADKIRMLANHGSKTKYIHEDIGYNSRLDEIQAAILLEKMKSVENDLIARSFIAQMYQELLKDLDIILPSYADGSFHSFNQYTIRTENREKIIEAFQKKNIGYMVYYPISLNKQKAIPWALYRDETDCSNAEQLTSQVLSLPIFPELKVDEVEEIAKTIREVLT